MNRSTDVFIKERGQSTNTLFSTFTGTGWDGPNVTTVPFSADDPLFGSAYGVGFFAAIRHFEKLKDA